MVHDYYDFSKTALIVNCEHTSQTMLYLLNAGMMTSDAISARRWFVGDRDGVLQVNDDRIGAGLPGLGHAIHACRRDELVADWQRGGCAHVSVISPSSATWPLLSLVQAVKLLPSALALACRWKGA